MLPRCPGLALDLPRRVTILLVHFEKISRIGEDILDLMEELGTDGFDNGFENLPVKDLKELETYCTKFGRLLSQGAIILPQKM